MAKKPSKPPIDKKGFDLDAFKGKEGLDNIIKEKPLNWIPLSEAFHDAVKVPGIPIGYLTSFRGFSNTGKSTAIYEGIVGCQKLGILPVIYETENNFSWEHARNIGVIFEEVKDENGVVFKPIGMKPKAVKNISDMRDKIEQKLIGSSRKICF